MRTTSVVRDNTDKGTVQYCADDVRAQQVPKKIKLIVRGVPLLLYARSLPARIFYEPEEIAALRAVNSRLSHLEISARAHSWLASVEYILRFSDSLCLFHFPFHACILSSLIYLCSSV